MREITKSFILQLLFGNIGFFDRNYKDIEWEELLSFLKVHKLLGTYFQVCKNICSQENIKIDEVFGRYITETYHYQKLFQNNQICEMFKLLEVLKNENLKPIIVKGPIISDMLYGGINNRTYNDIDFIIKHEKELKEYIKLLKKVGYNRVNYGWLVYGVLDEENIIFPESYDHHEIGCCKGYITGDCNESFVELKKTTSALPIRLSQYLNSSLQIYNLNGYEVFTYDLENMFILLCSNTFMNSEGRIPVFEKNGFLRDYVDLFKFIKKFCEKMQVKIIIDRINRYKLAHRICRVVDNMICVLKNENIVNREMRCLGFLNDIANRSNYVFDYAADIYKERDDLFQDLYAHPCEVFPWKHSFSDRIFQKNFYYNEGIVGYKNNFYCLQQIHKVDKMETITNESDLEILKIYERKNLRYSFFNRNGEYCLLLDLHKIEENNICVKFEWLTEPDKKDIFFNGFFCNKDNCYYVNRGKVFNSIGKHYNDFEDEFIVIRQIKKDIFICKFNSNIVNIFAKYNKLVYRISLVLCFDKDFMQETMSFSGEILV